MRIKKVSVPKARIPHKAHMRKIAGTMLPRESNQIPHAGKKKTGSKGFMY